MEEQIRLDLSMGHKRTILYVFKHDSWNHQELEALKSWINATGGGSLGLGGILEEQPENFLNFHKIENVKKIFVAIPQSSILKRTIDRLAKLVASEGSLVEQAVTRIEQKNPDFSFLFVKNSDEYIYYRWKVFCLCQGNYPTRLEPF